MIFRHFVAGIVALTILPPSEPNVAQAFHLHELSDCERLDLAHAACEMGNKLFDRHDNAHGRKVDISKIVSHSQSAVNEHMKKLSESSNKTSSTINSSIGEATKVGALPEATPTAAPAVP